MTEQQLSFHEEGHITPLKEILNSTPSPSQKPPTDSDSKSISESLDAIFPEQKFQDKQIQKAKETLGKLTKEFTESQLKDVVTEIQFLADCWLDDFERKTFGGLTLQELLHEKGGI